MSTADGWDLVTVIGMALITVLTRTFFFLSGRDWIMPAWAEAGLKYAPAAALSAVVVPELITDHGVLISTWKDARLFAAFAGAAWFFWRRGVLGTIVAGMAVYLPLHVGLGW